MIFICSILIRIRAKGSVVVGVFCVCVCVFHGVCCVDSVSVSSSYSGCASGSEPRSIDWFCYFLLLSDVRAYFSDVFVFIHFPGFSVCFFRLRFDWSLVFVFCFLLALLLYKSVCVCVLVCSK